MLSSPISLVVAINSNKNELILNCLKNWKVLKFSFGNYINWLKNFLKNKQVVNFFSTCSSTNSMANVF